jgi:2Fe-2S ferredoxin
MPKVVYKLHGGGERAVDVPVGSSVMLGAVNNNIKGIEAECGGCCSCATCHVYVDPAFYGRLPPPDSTEAELLTGTAAPARPTSRLSCQITVTPELDGLTVEMPERQI